MEPALGEQVMKLIRRDLSFWETTGNQAAIEEWRQRQLKQMYSLSEFIGCEWTCKALMPGVPAAEICGPGMAFRVVEAKAPARYRSRNEEFWQQVDYGFDITRFTSVLVAVQEFTPS